MSTFLRWCNLLSTFDPPWWRLYFARIRLTCVVGLWLDNDLIGCGQAAAVTDFGWRSEYANLSTSLWSEFRHLKGGEVTVVSTRVKKEWLFCQDCCSGKECSTIFCFFFATWRMSDVWKPKDLFLPEFKPMKLASLLKLKTRTLTCNYLPL